MMKQLLLPDRLKTFIQGKTLQDFKPFFCVAHVGNIEFIVSHIFQPAEPRLKKFRNTVWSRATIFCAKVEVPLVPLVLSRVCALLQIHFASSPRREGGEGVAIDYARANVCTPIDPTFALSDTRNALVSGLHPLQLDA
jgi:hypothetical protein